MQTEEVVLGMSVLWIRKTTSHWGEVVNFEEIPALVRHVSKKRVRIEIQDGTTRSVKVESLRQK